MPRALGTATMIRDVADIDANARILDREQLLAIPLPLFLPSP